MADVTTYALVGPSTTTVHQGDILTFTVSIAGTLGTAATITPAASVSTSGTFSPTTVSLSTANPSATFTFTPSKLAASNVISTTNSGSLTNPTSVTLAVKADLALTGPAAPTTGQQATYEVSLGPGVFSGNLVVTPALSPAGWTISPSTVTLTNSARTKAFTVTPTTTTPATLSVSVDTAIAFLPTALTVAPNYNTTSLLTTVRNTSGVTKYFAYLGPRGCTLHPSETFSYPGNPIDGLNFNGFPSPRDIADFTSAVRNGLLEIIDSPGLILKDSVTGDIKEITLSNGTLGTVDPSYGPQNDL